MNAFLFLLAIPAGILSVVAFARALRSAGRMLISEEEGTAFEVDSGGSLRKKYLEYDRF